MNDEHKNLTAALQYADMGFSVIPVCTPIDAKHCIHHGECKSPGKIPLVGWTQNQSQKATKEQIIKWFEKYPNANVGAVTGAESAIAVVDIDTTEKIDYPLPPTVMSRTGSGGFHCLYKYPGVKVKTCTRIIPNVDIRGDGGIIVLPPSLHQNGKHYEWVLSPEDTDLAELPNWVLEKINDGKEEVKPKTSVDNNIYEGQRNNEATRFAGKLLHALSREDWGIGWSVIQEWNQKRCTPPLTETELRRTFDSIAGRENNKNENDYEVQALRLSELLEMEFPNSKWLVDRLIPHEGLTIITAAPASYKTFLTLDIALKVANGEKVFGEFETTQSPVLIVDEENHLHILKERIALLSKNQNLPVFISSKKGFLLGKNSVDKLVNFARSKNIKLIIFDSLICIHKSNEDVASEMRNVMKHLKEITNQGIAVIVIHHHRKKREGKADASQDIRGSGDILAQVDCHLAIDRKNRNDASVTIYQSKLREAPEMQPFTVQFHSDGNKASFDYVGSVKEKQNKKDDIKESVVKILKAADKPISKTDILKAIEQSGVKIAKSTFKIAVSEMIEAGEVFTQQGNKNTTLCSLKKSESNNS